MRKRLYHYEVELRNDFFESLKEITTQYDNYALVKQVTEDGSFTYIGLNAKDYIYSDSQYLNIINKNKYLNKKGDYLNILISWLNKHHIITPKKFAPFLGGAIGFINDNLYDYYNHMDTRNEIPHLCFMVFDEFIVVDHDNNKLIFGFIDEYNKENITHNKFINLKKKISEAKAKATQNICLKLDYQQKVEEDERIDILSSKYAQDKHFIINLSTSILIEQKIDYYDIFNSLLSSDYKQIALFKTNDFSAITFTKNDYLSLNDKKIKYSNNNLENFILKDLLYNQMSKLKINETKMSQDIILEGQIKESSYQVLNNFKILEHQYGIPFSRNHNYIRRMEPQRFTGLIGFIGYNGNLFLLESNKCVINNKDVNYISFTSTLNNEMTKQQFNKQSELKLGDILNSINKGLIQ